MIDVVPPILYLRLLLLMEKTTLVSMGAHQNSSLDLQSLPRSLREIVSFLIYLSQGFSSYQYQITPFTKDSGWVGVVTTAKVLFSKRPVAPNASGPVIPETSSLQVKWLGHTVSMIKKGQADNIMINLSFAIFNITMLKAVILPTHTEITA